MQYSIAILGFNTLASNMVIILTFITSKSLNLGLLFLLILVPNKRYIIV
jgi:hypothetical protein